MRNFEFPRWSGPFVGMIVGAYFGLKAGARPGIPLGLGLLAGVVVGGLAGCLILLLDPKRPEATADDLLAHFDAPTVTHPSGVVGRFLAIAGILLCWTPALGLALNLVGLCVNWKAEDWARKVSMVGLAIGGIITFVVVLGVFLN